MLHTTDMRGKAHEFNPDNNIDSSSLCTIRRNWRT